MKLYGVWASPPTQGKECYKKWKDLKPRFQMSGKGGEEKIVTYFTKEEAQLQVNFFLLRGK
jgi:hypothetical protein